MGITESNKPGKRIGIIGLGSIGIKHCHALQSLGIKEIVALRTNRGTKKVPAELESVIRNVTDLSEFQDLDAYIISNPTSMHLESLNSVIPYNKPIFIEKPLCNSIEEINLLKKIENHNMIQVGFCLRFNKLIQTVKELIDKNVLGEIYHCRLNVGQFLPNWHPYTDYRNEYFSRKELGGGALRTLSHEIDLAQFFFGFPKQVKAFVSKVSDLEIDVDDYALLLLKYNNLMVRIELDFLQKNPERTGKVFGTKGDLTYDFFKNEVSVYDLENNLIESIAVEKNDMYRDQMDYFMQLDNNSVANASVASFNESIDQLKIIGLAEQYSLNNKWIDL